MSKAAPAPEAADDEAPAAKPRGKRWPMILGIVLLLGAAGGGAGFYFSRGDSGHEEAEPVKELPPIYIPLETFTVNLQPEAGDQFLQVNFSLKVSDEKVQEAVKLRMPEIRNRLLLLLSSKKASELIPAAGKEMLSRQIQDQVNHVLEPARFPAIPITASAAAGQPSATPDPAAPATPPGAAPEAGQVAATPHEAAPAALPTPIGTAQAATPAGAVTAGHAPTLVASPAAAPGVPSAPAAPGAASAAHGGEAKPGSAEAAPVTGVLFTSFIIQ